MRISIQRYNDQSDVDALVEALREILPRAGAPGLRSEAGSRDRT